MTAGLGVTEYAPPAEGPLMRASRHCLWPIAPRQNASSVTQHDQPARILGHPASIERPGNGQVVMPIDDFLLAGAFAALFEQLDGILAFFSDTMPNVNAAHWLVVWCGHYRLETDVR
jgi:hypothetical protein